MRAKKGSVKNSSTARSPFPIADDLPNNIYRQTFRFLRRCQRDGNKQRRHHIFWQAVRPIRSKQLSSMRSPTPAGLSATVPKLPAVQKFPPGPTPRSQSIIAPWTLNFTSRTQRFCNRISAIRSPQSEEWLWKVCAIPIRSSSKLCSENNALPFLSYYEKSNRKNFNAGTYPLNCNADRLQSVRARRRLFSSP